LSTALTASGLLAASLNATVSAASTALHLDVDAAG
jgi:hypothetical protein